MKKSLERGELLYRSKLFVQHAGVYIGNGKVLHNSPKGGVQISSFDEYADGKPVKVIDSDLTQDEKEVLYQQAVHLAKEAESYNLFGFNCEHLASLVLSKRPASRQLQATCAGAAAGVAIAKMSQSEGLQGLLLGSLFGGLAGCLIANATREYDGIVEAGA